MVESLIPSSRDISLVIHLWFTTFSTLDSCVQNNFPLVRSIQLILILAIDYSLFSVYTSDPNSLLQKTVYVLWK